MWKGVPIVVTRSNVLVGIFIDVFIEIFLGWPNGTMLNIKQFNKELFEVSCFS